MYALTPVSFKRALIDTFKHNPRAVVGITRSHLIIHSVKVLHKYDLAALLIPLTGLALLLSFLPAYLIWSVCVGSIIALSATISNAINQIFRRRQ